MQYSHLFTLLSTGDIVTMISVDCERIWLGSLIFHWLWAGPCMAIIAMILLIMEVGIAGMRLSIIRSSSIDLLIFLLTGVTALVVMILLNYIQKKTGENVGVTRKRQVKHTAQRTQVMNEILQVMNQFNILHHKNDLIRESYRAFE
jgi:hypothetical protein